MEQAVIKNVKNARIVINMINTNETYRIFQGNFFFGRKLIFESKYRASAMRKFQQLKRLTFETVQVINPKGQLIAEK